MIVLRIPHDGSYRPKLGHAGVKDVDREAELNAPSRVGCSELLGCFTSKDEMGMQASFINDAFEIPALATVFGKHLHQKLVELVL